VANTSAFNIALSKLAAWSATVSFWPPEKLSTSKLAIFFQLLRKRTPFCRFCLVLSFPSLCYSGLAISLPRETFSLLPSMIEENNTGLPLVFHFYSEKKMLFFDGLLCLSLSCSISL
jgi:hypothetical protein